MAHMQLILSGCLASFAIYFLIRVKRKPPAPYPPGPKGVPLVGNVFDMPSTYLWRTFMEWGRIYGDIVYVNVFGKSLVILNSAKQATSMLDMKSSIYSDRLNTQMGGELVGWNKSLPGLPYGRQSREQRRYIHQSVGSKVLMGKHHEAIVDENRKFLKRVLGGDEDIGLEIHRLVGAITLRIAYGYIVQEGTDPLLTLVEGAVLSAEAVMTPGRWLVDTLPFLRYLPEWIPGAGFKQVAAESRKLLLDMVNIPYGLAKKISTSGASPLSSNLVAENIGSRELDHEAEHALKWAASSVYAGGSETTGSTMHTFILAMILHPDVQKRAQVEVGRIVGDERLPSFADRGQLPFIEAIIKECLRWKCVAPLTFPHCATQDDIHDGYFIPKGTTVLANIWAILHDPETYPDPDSFDPSRFVTDNGEVVDGVLDPYDVCFGYGRRVCPGNSFADASLFIWCATMLSVYEFSKAVGPDGKVEEPLVEYTSGVVSFPKPFKYSIAPRSEKAKKLILSG